MKKPIGVAITDTHLEEKTIERNISVFQQADDLAQELGVDIFHLGDIFTSRKSQPQIVLNTFGNILDNLKSRMNAIPGNHDKVDYNSSDSYLDTFKHYPNFRLIKMIGGFPIGDVTIHMFPFYSESGTYFEKLKEILDDDHLGWGEKNILLTHVGITGVKNNDKSVVINSIKQELFDKWDLVLVGHYHDRSLVGDNINYIGSTFQGNFGEDINKGCVIIYDDLSIEYRQFEFPKYIVEEIDLDELDLEQIEKIHQFHVDSKDFIRFKFTGAEEKIKSLDKSKYEKDGINVIAISKELESEIGDAENGFFVSFTKSNLEEEFTAFCEENKLEYKDGIPYLKRILEKK